jgi:PAS domain S-box-containing protein
MNSGFYQKMMAALTSQTRKNRNYGQLFVSFGVYLLPGALLVLGVLWFKSLAIDVSVHNRYLANLRQMQYLCAHINQNVLQARAGTLNSYDPIVNDLARLQQLQTDLKQTPSYIDSEGHKELHRLLQDNIQIWQQKEESVLRFQSQNAILFNSLTYFPIVIADLVKKDTTSPALANRLNALLRDILLFDHSTDKTLVAQIEREIQQISADIAPNADGKAIEMALTHAKIILSRRAQVKDSVEVITELPTTQSTENLALAYNRHYQQALNTKNNYRLWFYLLSLFLLVGISAWILLRIRLYALAAQEAEAKYRSIFENSVTGIFQEQPDGRFLNANLRLANIYGYESVSALLANVTDIGSQIYVLPERRQELVRLLEEKGSVANFESQIYRPDGTTIWISENTRCVRDREGKSLYYEGTVTDINGRKQAEAALQASEAKFLAAFRSAPSPFFLATIPDGFLIEVNDSFCRETGYTREEAIGRNGLELNLYQNPEDHRRVMQTLLEKGSIRRLEIESRTRKRVRTVQFSAEIIHFNGQDCILVVSEDITDRKRVEIALREAKVAAESANRTKSQFLANMSHELRTPLNIILGFTQLLLRDALPEGSTVPPENRLLTSQQKDYLGTITRSGEHLLGLINDVLEMSKIEAGRASFNATSVDLYEQLNTLREMWQPKATAKGLELTINWQAEVPQFISTDASKLRQVLMNLLSNAIKFTETGRVSLRVSQKDIGTQRYKKLDRSAQHTPSPAAQLCFEIADTGAGIDPNELKILFHAFSQTETGRKSQQGTGLGLAISREFVQLMGGNLTLETEVGLGTTFWLDIPLVIAAAPEGSPQQPYQRVIGLADNQPRYRLLVVEDHPENRQLLTKLLQPIGFEVEQAENGQEAIALWESFAPHLIWMDLRMPVMDGYEATKQIRTQIKSQGNTQGKKQTTIIIALTASAFEEERTLALSAGCDDFLRKPFREEEIFAKMSHYLGVRYRYEPLILNAKSNLTQVDASAALLGLERMPTEWREHLHQAATQVDAAQIKQLIAQIPPEDSPLALTITDLINRYRFDQIVELTQSAGSNGL